MAHLNVWSLWNKFDLVRQMVQTSGVDMISLSETWLNKSTLTNLINIQGYTCIRHDRSWKETLLREEADYVVILRTAFKYPISSSVISICQQKTSNCYGLV